MISPETILDILINAKFSASNQIVAQCPYCKKNDHFFINRNTGLWDCKKCNEVGNIGKLLRYLRLDHLLEGEAISHERLPYLFELNASNEKAEDEEIPDFKMPIGCRQIKYEDNNEISDYLKSRKFTKTDFGLYTPQYTKLKKKYLDYVLLPVYQDYAIKGFVGRCLLKESKKPRYLNSKGVDFAKLLLGVDEISRHTDTAILVEGYFDKVSTTNEMGLHEEDEIKCFCTFKHSVSDAQFKMMKKIGIKNIILLYDERDSVEIMKDEGSSLERQFNVFIGSTGINDPGASDASDFERIMSNLKKPIHYKYNVIQENVLK